MQCGRENDCGEASTMKCSFKPYIGEEPYIFISYAHSDDEIVGAILEKLDDNGFRLWYDKGIESGGKWRNEIALNIENCDAFIAFLSNSYAKSGNCYLESSESFKLDRGIDMYICQYQNMKYYEYDSEEFYKRLLDVNILQNCRGGVDKETGELPQGCYIRIWSPVDADVILNDHRHKVARIYKSPLYSHMMVWSRLRLKFDLTMQIGTYEKTVTFDRHKSGSMTIHLEEYFDYEILEQYFDRDRAIKEIQREIQMSKENHSLFFTLGQLEWAFMKQLEIVGMKEDIEILKEFLELYSCEMQNLEYEHWYYLNYVIACGVVTIGKLCIKYNTYEYVEFIEDLYNKCHAKKSLGRMYEDILNVLPNKRKTRINIIIKSPVDVNVYLDDKNNLIHLTK